ncbi:MAG TPA: hypothetical protein VFQ91_03250 [Bryobacteraceae bacterium]|nr:hypothetical protein [Bryobacteraceae bacterium]
MSKPVNRGSLLGLKTGLPPVPRVAPVAATAEMEELILGASGAAPVKEEVDISLRKDVSTYDISPAAPPALRRKEPTVLMNAKLPLRLHAQLKRTAQFNDLSMTDILIRAIEAELASGRYVAPPENWGRGIEE